MTNDQKNNNGARYFYTVVFITLTIAGVVVWQLFFSGDRYEAPDEDRLENTPKVDFAFLDSHIFGDLDNFQKKDEPLLPWEQIRNPNPFKSPEIPKERELRNWWAIFNIELNLEDDKWVGVYPEVIKDEEFPTLTLFEDRWYEFKWNNSSDDNFEIMTENEETIVDFNKDKEEDSLKFQASKDMSKYKAEGGDDQGEIDIITSDFENYGSSEEDNEEERESLIEAGNELSELHSQIEASKESLDEDLIIEAEEAYSELEMQFQQLEESIDSEEKEEVNKEINNFRERVNDLINNLESEDEEM